MGKHVYRNPLGDHEQGYCRPPTSTQFPHQQRAPRQPKAQPRHIATRQFMKEFFEAVEEPVTVTQNGKKTKIPAAVAINKQLVMNAVKGEPWAIRRAIDMQLALIREYEAEQVQIQGALNYLEQRAKRGPLKPEEVELRIELERRVNNARELFEDEVRPRRK
jgi:hypothetical protein